MPRSPEDPIEGDVWRRVPPWHFPTDPTRTHPSSAAFDDDRDGDPMSVVIAQDVLNSGRDQSDVLGEHDGFGLVALSVEELRALGMTVIWAPVDDEPAHALVVGPKKGSAKRTMSKSARWVVPPP